MMSLSLYPDVAFSLQNPSDSQTWKANMTKATEKLNKTLAEADIRLLAENLTQKCNSEV